LPAIPDSTTLQQPVRVTPSTWHALSIASTHASRINFLPSATPKQSGLITALSVSCGCAIQQHVKETSTKNTHTEKKKRLKGVRVYIHQISASNTSGSSKQYSHSLRAIPHEGTVVHMARRKSFFNDAEVGYYLLLHFLLL
jgi:hypothetical protein